MLRERNQTFKLVFIFMDLVLAACAYATALVLHFGIVSPDKWSVAVGDYVLARLLFDSEEHGLAAFLSYTYLGFLFCMSQVVVFVATDLYHPRRGQSHFREWVGIARGVVFNLIVVVALLFFYRGASYSRILILYTAGFALFYFMAGHWIFRALMERLRARGFNTRDVLVLGTGDSALRLVDILARHSLYGYRVIGLVGPKAKTHPALEKMIVGTFRDFRKIAQRMKPQMIVYAMPMDTAKLETVVEFCDTEGLDCRIVPEIVRLITQNARITEIEGLPILSLRDIPLKNGYNRFVKRMFDIAVASVTLMLASPLLTLIALLIKLTMPGPIFFRQERVGLDNRIFSVFKFRTMIVQEKNSSDTVWGSQSDNRVTTLGKILRKTSLDELPQAINVLLGDMSIVGPRPERPHFVTQFKSQYTHYMRRHAVKAGITGWAQVQGYRGDTSIEKRVQADIYYIENWTFWFDMLIILKTLPALFRFPGE